MSSFNQLNEWGRHNVPFIFFIDYEGKQVQAFPFMSIPNDVAMSFGAQQWGHVDSRNQLPVSIDSKTPVQYEKYLLSFQTAHENMVQGNTYLLNLTFPTQIDLNGSLADVYQQGGAPYRLYWKDHFCCFSPESFVSIENDQIHTTPVKGTSSLAEDPEGQGLLKNEKERAEHAMVVDLLRNDLAQVATDVSVNKFRYLEQVQTDHGALWQTESLIKGTMSADWPSHVGDILQKLTPPGSVTGMPKHETCKIIDAIENTPRGFYCGIFGYYQDHELHSAVSIRFIAQKGASFYYHSGGGITVDSNPRSEYEEMLLKVYLSGEKNAF